MNFKTTFLAMAILLTSLFSFKPAHASWTGPFYTVSESDVMRSSSDLPTGIGYSLIPMPGGVGGQEVQSYPSSLNGSWKAGIGGGTGLETGDVQGRYKWVITVYYKWVGSANPAVTTWDMNGTIGAYTSNDLNAAYDETITVDGNIVSSTANNASGYGQGVSITKAPFFNASDNCYEVKMDLLISLNAYCSIAEGYYDWNFKTTAQMTCYGASSPGAHTI